jgi:hypothetical protein
MKLIDMYCVVGFLALLYLASYSTYEHMTSKDVQKHQEHHARGGSWNMNHHKKVQQQEIKGPTTTEKGNPDPDSGDSKSKGPKTGVYPDIYGPEILLAPGHKDHQGSHNPEPYDFLPAAEFPAGPNAPSPFLTDFSKLLKT